MDSTIDTWKHQLSSLPSGERLELAHFLLGSVEPSGDDTEAEWDAEASRRIAEIRDGHADGRPLEALLAELRERYP